MNTETIAPLLNEAEQYLSHRDFDRAAELYARAREFDGDRSPIPTVGLARIALCLGRVDDAATLLAPVLAKHPNCALAHLVNGAVNEARGRHEDALVAYARAVATDSELGLAHFNLARALSRRGDWRRARVCIERAVELMPKNSDALSFATQCAARTGDVTTALKWGTQAAASDPDSENAIGALADALVEAGQLELAVRTLDNGLERVPTAGMLHSKRAALAIRADDVKTALRHTTQVMQLEPHNVDAKLLAAIFFTTTGDFVQAIKLSQDVLALDGNEHRAHFQLGMLFEAIGHKPAAMQSYRSACSSPTQWSARVNLAILLLEEGAPRGWREATQLLLAALPHAPKHEQARVHYNLALAFARQQESARAREYATHASASLDPTISADAKLLLKELSTH